MTKRAAALAEVGLLSNVNDQIRRSLIETRKKGRSDTSSPSYLTDSNEAYQMVLLRYVKDASAWIDPDPATPDEEQLMKNALSIEWDRHKRGEDSDRQTNSAIKPLEKFTGFEEDWRGLFTGRLDSRNPEWGQSLLNIRSEQRTVELQQQNARWDELKGFRCDPWNELKLFELSLSKPPVQKKNVTEQRQFDIGQVARTQHFGGTDQEAFNAYAFLRFCEEVGLPFRVGNYAMATSTAVASLQRISHYSPFWATATLIRVGDEEAVDSLFSRESVYSFTMKEADQLIQNYLDLLNKCREDIRTGNAFRNDNYGVRLAKLLPEVISRLCCKCSIETKHRILGFITDVYGSLEKTNYRNMGNLTKRFIGAMSEAEQYRLVPELLKIPYPEGLSLIAKSEFRNPFMLLNLHHKPECGGPTLEIQPRFIDNLLEQSALDDPDRRRWAISSLVTLYRLQLLSADQSKKLAVAIWCRTDQQYRLPDHTDFYKFAFLDIPHPEGVDPCKLFKNYVRCTPFPNQKGQQGDVGITGGNIPLVYEIIGANSKGNGIWTTEDAVEFLRRLLERWDGDKERLDGTDNASAGFLSIQEEFRFRFSRMIELLAEVVGPKLGADSTDDIKSSLDRLLREMREHGLLVLEAEAACLHIYPDRKAEIYNRIYEALISNQSNIEKDGLRAIAKIIFGGIDTEASSMEHDPTLMFSQYLTWGPTHSIIPALWIVIRILKNTTSKFSTTLEVATQGRLDRLLNETAYEKSSPYLNFEEKLEVRRIAAILAATLWAYYNSCGSTVPRAVEKWRGDRLSADEFAEIRNAWGDCDGT